MRYLWLLTLLAVGVAGCGGGQSTGATSTGRLQIAVRLWPRACPFGALARACENATPNVRRYTLRCNPAGGSVPNPRAACRAIADYLTQRRHAGGCIGLAAGPGSTAVISGRHARSRFRLRITAGGSWCGQPPALIRDYWVLSTFPCSTPVIRTGGRSPTWPRATGCTIDSG